MLFSDWLLSPSMFSSVIHVACTSILAFSGWIIFRCKEIHSSPWLHTVNRRCHGHLYTGFCGPVFSFLLVYRVELAGHIYLPVFIILAIIVWVWNRIPLWLSHVFPWWWLMTWSIFSSVDWAFVQHHLKNAHILCSLLIRLLGLLLNCKSSLYPEYVSYQIYDLQIFPYIPQAIFFFSY